MVVIGIDPHQGSHTAVAVDEDEHKLGEVRVRADRRQLERLQSLPGPRRTLFPSAGLCSAAPQNQGLDANRLRYRSPGAGARPLAKHSPRAVAERAGGGC